MTSQNEPLLFSLMILHFSCVTLQMAPHAKIFHLGCKQMNTDAQEQNNRGSSLTLQYIIHSKDSFKSQ